jgi:hypothetical protein
MEEEQKQYGKTAFILGKVGDWYGRRGFCDKD